MNNNYKWNGTTFNSKGIIIESTPIIPRAKRSYNTYEIPGRDGFLTIDNKTYEGITFSMECHFKEGADVNEIRAFLNGYGTLQVDNEKEYTGYISNQIDFEKIVRFRRFIIQFRLQPIAKALTTTTETRSTTGTFTSTTYTNTYPKITITCSGNVTIGLNDISFTLHGASGTYILDCEAKVITKNGVNASNIMSGDFPYVKNGTNNLSVTGSVSSMTTEYKKTYL